MVEVVITLTPENTKVTQAFKPRRRVDRLEGAVPRSESVPGARRSTD
ncbi:hypothetical protein [Acinetobacter sp.]